ncbi:hypothetical protein [Parapedobacter koreensis]|uniref:Uncharacterized protein n=1 Tax=Parapedobacter koreensis TaxID=332977 RepID=A0A1H7FZL5_9SPHI|nr:hypothetical protein [Parapedobacter koreensis]SEK31496.1 hypothetical protein SAMN05421740_101519 [Parapedobacter koreensis]
MYQSRREDYIERLIKRFFEALERVKGKNSQALDDALPDVQDEMAALYEEYFGTKRQGILQQPVQNLPEIVATLEPHQLRPLALLLYHDAMRQSSGEEKWMLLARSKALLMQGHAATGQIDFEDVQLLSHIEQELADW